MGISTTSKASLWSHGFILSQASLFTHFENAAIVHELVYECSIVVEIVDVIIFKLVEEC